MAKAELVQGLQEALEEARQRVQERDIDSQRRRKHYETDKRLKTKAEDAVRNHHGAPHKYKQNEYFGATPWVSTGSGIKVQLEAYVGPGYLSETIQEIYGLVKQGGSEGSKSVITLFQLYCGKTDATTNGSGEPASQEELEFFEQVVDHIDERLGQPTA